jgi:broad specificity phosphatase PhoE
MKRWPPGGGHHCHDAVFSNMLCLGRGLAVALSDMGAGFFEARAKEQRVELVLVRHGETEYNRADVFRGRIDLPLNDRGMEQARAAADYLSAQDFEAFYCSPLQRAVQTARAIAEPHHGEVSPLEYFIDVDYGEWSGKSIDEIRDSWPREFAIWTDDPERAVFPGGEAVREVRERLYEGLEWLAREQEGTVLLVGHKLINRIMICIVLGLPTAGIWRVDQSNAAINFISREDRGWMLRRLNDISHLRGLESIDQQT